MREVLGIWDDDVQVGNRVDVLAWVGWLTVGLSRMLVRCWCWMCHLIGGLRRLAWRRMLGDGRTLVMVRREPGLTWVVPRVQRFAGEARHCRCRITSGHAGWCADSGAGCSGRGVLDLTTGDVGRSCGWFQEAVKDGDCASWAAGLERGCGERSDSALW